MPSSDSLPKRRLSCLAAVGVLCCGLSAADRPVRSEPILTVPSETYAAVDLQLTIPGAPASLADLRLLGGLRGDRMPVDHGLALREPGGELRRVDERLVGRFERGRDDHREALDGRVIEIDARIAEDGSVSGSAVLGELRGTVSGSVIAEAELRRRNGLDPRASWPAFLGPHGRSTTAVPTGTATITSPADIRLAWRSEAIDIGQGPGSISRFMQTWNHASTRRTGSGAASPILADGLIILTYVVPTPQAHGFDLGPNTRGNRNFPALAAAMAEQAGLEAEALPGFALEKIWEAVDEVVVALDAETGAESWRLTRPARGVNLQHHKEGPFNLTAAAHGGRVFALGLGGELVAIDLSTGRPLWEERVTAPSGALSATVIAVDDVVVAPSGHGRGAVWIALDAASGEARWRSNLGAAHASLAVWPLGDRHILLGGGGADLANHNQSEIIQAIDASSGTVLWSLDLGRDPARPTALRSSGRGLGPGGLSVSGNTLLTYTTAIDGTVEDRSARRASSSFAIEAWELRENGPHQRWSVAMEHHNGEHVPVVLHDRYVVIADLRLLDLATGAVVATIPGVRPGNGGYLQAMDDLLLVRRDGTHGRVEIGLTRISADGTITPLTGEGSWTPPVGGGTTSYHHPIYYPLGDGRLFLRQRDGIYAWDLRRDQP